jgi:hypothetical protein
MPHPIASATPRVPSSSTVATEAAKAIWAPRHFALLATVGALLAIHRAEAVPDTDVLWSARYGLDLTSTGSVPRSDTYSWTAPGRTWIPSSWGWNVVLGIAHRAAGMAGLWTVAILVAVALAIVVGVAARRIGAAPLPTVMAFSLLGIFALVVLPRAQATGYLIVFAIPPLLPAILFGSWRRAGRAVAILIVLQIIWMNLHASAVLGPVLVLAGGAAILVGSRPPRAGVAALRLVAAAAAAVAACFATPYGWAPVRHIPDVRRDSVGLINEWDHAGVHGLGQLSASFAIVLAAVFAVTVWRQRRFDTVGILFVLAAASASAVRFAPMLVVFLIPEVALAIGRLNVRPVFFRRAVALGMVALAGLAGAQLGSFAGLSDRTASPQLVDKLPHGCRLLNDYTIGAAVILDRPDVKVSIDSRNDMYGRAQVLENESVLENEVNAREWVDAHAVTCVLAYTGYNAVRLLSRTSGWTIVDRDTQRTLLVRR